ncbi:hypothetical protein [Pseudobacteroides cellulosolvens]|uniref:Lipoprotein n=1 Tax=Pseudobacteroides cellulosolvens ATCC 35603 = DSM 2933 TaxID=398512 RepID=A0A0L6JTP6_9FIRM|nr:hypothetical protein [Pseudobacteroides cellulosolvens]KNY28782.1 hypothetical protein Bccel_4056 [Pseudobacteroides cellulosolvens ATCC 35603 = DSM 2933]
MKRLGSILLLAIVMTLLLVFGGCKHKSEEKTYIIGSSNDLIHALEDKNYKIEYIKPHKDEVAHSFFSVYAKRIKVDGEMLAIYEFENSDVAESQANTISKDGYSIGNALISWVDKPHFFKKEKTIVEYIGSKKSLIKDLEAILGKSLTEQE